MKVNVLVFLSLLVAAAFADDESSTTTLADTTLEFTTFPAVTERDVELTTPSTEKNETVTLVDDTFTTIQDGTTIAATTDDVITEFATEVIESTTQDFYQNDKGTEVEESTPVATTEGASTEAVTDILETIEQTTQDVYPADNTSESDETTSIATTETNDISINTEPVTETVEVTTEDFNEETTTQNVYPADSVTSESEETTTVAACEMTNTCDVKNDATTTDASSTETMTTQEATTVEPTTLESVTLDNRFEIDDATTIQPTTLESVTIDNRFEIENEQTTVPEIVSEETTPSPIKITTESFPITTEKHEEVVEPHTTNAIQIETTTSSHVIEPVPSNTETPIEEPVNPTIVFPPVFVKPYVDCRLASPSGFVGNRANCNLVFRCIKVGFGPFARFLIRNYACPEGMYFNVYTQLCSRDPRFREMMCGPEPSTALPITTTPPPPKKALVVVLGKIDCTKATPSGFLGDRLNCNQAYQCVPNGRGSFFVKKFRCPWPNYYFNVFTDSCDNDPRFRMQMCSPMIVPGTLFVPARIYTI